MIQWTQFQPRAQARGFGPLLHRLTGRCRAVEAAACARQPGNAASVERRLPAAQLLVGEQVALTRFLASDDAGARSDNDGRLAARRPPLCVRWGQDEGGLALIQPAGGLEFSCAGSPVIIGVRGSGYRLRVLHGMNCTMFRSNCRAAQATAAVWYVFPSDRSPRRTPNVPTTRVGRVYSRAVVAISQPSGFRTEPILCVGRVRGRRRWYTGLSGDQNQGCGRLTLRRPNARSISG